MEDVVKSVFEKISSYDIFNNLFPGIVFSYVVSKSTRFSFTTDNIIEQLFLWYFIGMIISRIGSILVEVFLKKLKFKHKPYLVFADYKQYTAASEAKPFIATLSEINNTYRTIIALFLALAIIYIYDAVLFDWIAKNCVVGNELAIIIVGLLLIILFVKSYKKQTDYIRNQVKKYIDEQNHSQ